LLGEQVYADFEGDVIDLVNVEREARGLHPLAYDYSLAAAARDHSEDMGVQDYFSHTSLDGRTVGDRLMEAGYSYNTYGENIAAGQSTPEVVINSWMSSSGHRANILNPTQTFAISVSAMFMSQTAPITTTGHRTSDAKVESVPARVLPHIRLQPLPVPEAAYIRKETSPSIKAAM